MGVLSGYKRFKKYLRTGDGYKLCSEWTKSDSVEMNDGMTLQENMDNVADDVESTRNDIADVHNELKTSLGGMTFGVDAAGRYGYIKAGADTVTPFKSHANVVHFSPGWNGTNSNSFWIGKNYGTGVDTIRAKSTEKYDCFEGCIGIVFSVHVRAGGSTYANNVTIKINDTTITANAVDSQIGPLKQYVFFLSEASRPGSGDGYIYVTCPSIEHTEGYPASNGTLTINDFYVIT